MAAKKSARSTGSSFARGRKVGDFQAEQLFKDGLQLSLPLDRSEGSCGRGSAFNISRRQNEEKKRIKASLAKDNPGET
jgi:hypothetical protein